MCGFHSEGGLKMVTQLPLFTQAVVDAPSWLNSLSVSRQVLLDSSSDLIQRIQLLQQARQQAGYSDPVKNPCRVSQAPTQMQLAPAALLHAIGRVTTPVIPRLADLSSTWALYRYVWAFEASGNALRLSQFAKNIDFHQKGLLSDEVGVGMAYWLMTELFNAQTFIDVDVALRSPQLLSQMNIPPVSQNLRTVPDYIFMLPNNEYAIVECKGSQSGRNTSMNQLRRGLEQVPSIAFASGETAKEFVVATSLSTDETVVYLVDPPADQAEETFESDRRNHEPGKRRFTIRDKGSFDRSTRRLHGASLLAFSGAGRQAVDLAGVELPEGIPVRDRPLEETRISEIDAIFGGYSYSVPLRGPVNLGFSVFQGIAQDTYDVISRRSTAENWTESLPEPEYWPRVRNRAEQEASNIVALLAESGDAVYSFGIDGSFLRLALA
jgi:hypothetical protein